MANAPTVLLADEPTGALDSDGGLEILELFRRLHADGQTVIMVTHSTDVAAGADRRLTMRDGRLVGDTADGPAISSDLAAESFSLASASERTSEPR
jgi:putative ABC transport system ATP-binding protein